jgi:predicted Fe-Mo cluster-binding NifX family protein
MNVKIGYTSHFIAGVWWDSRLIMSTYTVTFKMITATDSAQDTNTALDRLRYMVEEYLVDTVFIKDTDQEQIALLTAAGIKVIALPEEPVDQIIGMMLYSKLSAVMEGCMLIRSIMLSSTAGDDVIYEHDAQESVAPFDQPGWWSEPTPVCESESQQPANDTVFVLNAVNQWRDLGLQWVSDVESDQDSNVLVFTEFRNDKDK